jgi:L-iditol 2-dehydrogenase
MVETTWAAICGSDLHALHAKVPLPERSTQPGYPGHEGIGVVAESRHPDFKPGDRVLTVPSRPNRTGTFVDLQTIMARFLIHLPETDVPMEQMLMAQQFGTTIFALRQHPVDVVGKTVMVMGQGSAGGFFAYNLKRAGAAKVIVSDKSEARLALSKHFGADLAVRADGDNVHQAVMDETGGNGVDYLVEAVGSSEALAESIGLIRPQGNGLYFGQPESKELVGFNFHDFQRNRLTINATTGTQLEDGLVSFKRALHLIVSGQIDVSPMISHTFELDKIEEAMQRAHERDDNARKVVIKI